MSREDQKTISTDEFAALDALERVRAMDQIYGSKLLLLASMQKPAGVLMHMIHRIQAKTFILFVDTQFHFPETLALRDRFMEKYGLKITTVYPEMTPQQQREKFGVELYNFIDGQPQCCNMRKEEPFLHAAKREGIRATMSGLMRVEGSARAKLEPIGSDPRLGIPTYYPLFDWTFEQLDDYSREHDVPIHPLYAKGYLSIGCLPCTTPVLPGEDRRAGRWRHLRTADGKQPQYCNINYGDGAGI